MICAPRLNGVRKPVENSNVWWSGSTESMPSVVSISKTDESIETMLVKFRCESITPLGCPVVPEVKMSEATVFGETFGGQQRDALVFGRLVGQLEDLVKRQRRVSKPGLGELLAEGRGARRRHFSPMMMPAAPPARAKLTISSVVLSGSTGTQVAPALSTPK